MSDFKFEIGDRVHLRKTGEVFYVNALYKGLFQGDPATYWVGPRFDTEDTEDGFMVWEDELEKIVSLGYPYIYWLGAGGFTDSAKDVTFSEKVEAILEEISDLLKEKNDSYGNSALAPVRIFSKASTEEQLYVRIDDKLSRIKNGGDDLGEDTINDLIGYLVLLKIHNS